MRMSGGMSWKAEVLDPLVAGILQLASSALGICAAAIFFRLLRWSDAVPIAEAPAAALEVLPGRCPAFHAEHGSYFCEHLGLSYQRPAVWISALILIVICGWLAWYFNSLHKRRTSGPSSTS